jgi:NAD(P)-dependent dehydrogenase (short-subunit alcohol dehydrogenase family)
VSAVLITGADRGLGLEFARQYMANGWDVFAACRDPRGAGQLHEMANRSGGKLTPVAMDVTKGESVRSAAKQLENVAIDLLINNAGTAGVPGQRTGNVDYENWARVLDVNAMGPLRVIEAFMEHFARSQRRLIVTITSGMGSLTDNTSGGSVAYRSSKAAVNMAMRSVAADLASRRITCVVVNPGWVRTDMGGASAPLTPEESLLVYCDSGRCNQSATMNADWLPDEMPVMSLFSHGLYPFARLP